jgi:hypothetical protein
MDYQDNHFYIDHYSFPNTAWDSFDWRVRDSAAADNGWSNFLDMAWARQAGRPYTVSEFNQPWPNTHAAELNPALAAFAARQDWDGVVHFAYSHGRGWDDGVPNGFNINGDWTKFGLIGQSAWMFRTGAVQMAAATLTVPVSAAERTQSATLGQSIANWVVNRAGLPKDAAFTRRVGLAPDSEAAMPKTPLAPASSSELTFDPVGKRVLLAAPMAAGIFGSLGSAKVTAGAIDLELGAGMRGIANILVTSRDGRPIGDSSRLLLSLPGYSLRAIPGTSPAKPQRLVPYLGAADWWTIDPAGGNAAKPSGDLNGGRAPTFVERVEAWVTLRTGAAAITVSVLDGAGSIIGELPAADVIRIDGGYRIHLNGAGQAPSPWYTISAQWRRRHR